MIAEQHLDGILLAKSTDIKFVVDSTAAESTVFPSGASLSKSSAEIKNEKRQVSTQDTDSADEAILLVDVNGNGVYSRRLPWVYKSPRYRAQVALPSGNNDGGAIDCRWAVDTDEHDLREHFDLVAVGGGDWVLALTVHQRYNLYL
ncbi:hypothetical protein LA080_007983 [Diaporthe eres]|nr:hypothetical protein LA080_007983 [Diaporthe eres]